MQSWHRWVLVCLLLMVPNTWGARQDTLYIRSTKMDTVLGTIVVVPQSATTYPSRKFPVVYLLHGWSGNFTNWPTKADLGRYADQFEFILVCPEGGYAGWYMDSPMNPKLQYESFIIDNVVPYIDRHYPTRSDRNHRAVCGLSMGGHGALYLFIRHPGVFGAAGSMSGVLELDQSTARYSIAQILGDYQRFSQRWREHSVLYQLSRLPQTNSAVLIDCGVDDRFITSNRKVHQKLLEMKYPHTYIERPGGHTWDYWIHALPYHLLFFQQYFERQQ